MNTNEIQTALETALAKYGEVDYKGRKVACIALHKIEDYSGINAGILCNLPWAADDTGAIKYDQRRVDQVWNLHIWRN